MGNPIEIIVVVVCLILGVLLLVAPLAIWSRVSKIQAELAKTNKLLRAQYDILAKIANG